MKDVKIVIALNILSFHSIIFNLNTFPINLSIISVLVCFFPYIM